MRNLVLILGDQLNRDSAAFDGLDPAVDLIWMAEVAGESTHVWSHKARIALFLAAMRHFRDALIQEGLPIEYIQLDDTKNLGTLQLELEKACRKVRPDRLVVVKPGDYRVERSIQTAAIKSGVKLEVREDRHFLCNAQEFARHCDDRKQIRMEYFYREMRRKYQVLMEGAKPAGGEWNYDAENRSGFGKAGPGLIAEPIQFAPDTVTKEILRLVEEQFPDHPGSTDSFGWPVTRAQAVEALDDFIENRLPDFGRFQDAMWQQEPFLYHSMLSTSLNLKLLHPLEVIRAAEAAYHTGSAPLEAVEGFIRQILGWREYVRGVYWQLMPDYLERNALGAAADLPEFYWTGETDMNCLRETIQQTLKHGYAHHIQRLMVTGLYALLMGVNPKQVHEWYLAVYVDAVEWVELPNTLGMSQYADGGLMSSKPYVATGKYIDRMSNYCAGCRFDPDRSVGVDACPFTTFYWDFLVRHETTLLEIPRMSLQVRNLRRKSPEELASIRRLAEELKLTPP